MHETTRSNTNLFFVFDSCGFVLWIVMVDRQQPRLGLREANDDK